ncbi:MAG: GAP family protein [Solirubrobacteraceae bacterium]|nr:GAP family protein [Solirubrobacteraceae bacterium]
MGDALGGLLPPAIAVALSPIPIIAIVLVLGSRHARTAGPSFALGWVAGLAVVAALVVLLLPGADPDADDAGVNWLELGIGVLFLGMAAQQWSKRPRQGEVSEMPGWMASIDRATPVRAAGLGVALSAANPKNLALTLTAAASIAEAGLEPADEAIAIAAFVVLGSVTVAGAVIAHLLLGERVAGPLGAVRQFMSDHNAVIMTVVLALLGAKLVHGALGGL